MTNLIRRDPFTDLRSTMDRLQFLRLRAQEWWKERMKPP